MNNDCQLVIFSDKAYNAIIRETFEWEPVETGGILLGHILDNGCWLVMEVLPPGYGEGREGDNVHHEMGYFEYNQRFVNYLAKSVAEQYEIPLELLGLWHRHPGSMDVFSGTDDRTNSTFASQNPKGVISGLVNVDPQLRMTMYHLAHNAATGFGRPPYDKVDVEVIGMEDIPEAYRKLRYYDGSEKALHPYAPNNKRRSNRQSRYDGFEHPVTPQGQDQTPTPKGTFVEVLTGAAQKGSSLPATENWLENLKKKPKLIILAIAIVCFLISLKPLCKNFEKLSNLFKKSTPEMVLEDIQGQEEIQQSKESSNEETLTDSVATEGDTLNTSK